MLSLNKESYWFYLEPYAYVSIKRDSLFLYNTLDGAILENKAPEILELVERMQSNDNLLVVKLEKDFIDQNSSVSHFVADVRRAFMGDLVDTALSPKKPVQMMPLLNIQQDIEKTDRIPNLDIGRDIMKYLHEITIHVNGECTLDCAMCNSAYKQFLCCYKNSSNHNELKVTIIERIISVAKGVGVSKINIIGGNIFLYPGFDKLVELLETIPAQKNFYTHYRNLPDQQEITRLLNSESFVLNLLVNFQVKEKELDFAVGQVKNIPALKTKFNFIVESGKDIEAAQQLIDRYRIEEYTYKPHFNGGNLEFLRENVFITQEKILASRHSMKDIFKKQKVNLFDFGHMVILNNGDIHTNIDAEKIGNITETTLHEAVYKEMTGGRNWRRTREDVEPCKQCHYNLLCPSISNYELILGRNNLCDIMDKNVASGTLHFVA